MEEKQQPMIKLSGLWLNEKNGQKYFSGNLGDAKVLIFKNKYKTDEKHPDFNLYLAPKPPKQQEAKQEKTDEYAF